MCLKSSAIFECRLMQRNHPFLLLIKVFNHGFGFKMLQKFIQVTGTVRVRVNMYVWKSKYQYNYTS